MNTKIDENVAMNFLDVINKIEDINEQTINTIEKSLFELLKEGLKNKEVIIEVAPYKINLTPQNLEVVYKDYIKIPNKVDSSTVVDNISYYLIRPTKERNMLYSSFNPIIRLKNIISIQDNIPRELLNIELLNGDGYDLKDYIEDSLDDNVIGNKTTGSFNINEKAERLNFEKYIIMNDLLPVYYDKESDSYLATSEEIVKEPYEKVIADIEKNKKIVKVLYDSLVKFFEKYN